MIGLLFLRIWVGVAAHVVEYFKSAPPWAGVPAAFDPRGGGQGPRFQKCCKMDFATIFAQFRNKGVSKVL